MMREEQGAECLGYDITRLIDHNVNKLKSWYSGTLSYYVKRIYLSIMKQYAYQICQCDKLLLGVDFHCRTTRSLCNIAAVEIIRDLRPCHNLSRYASVVCHLHLATT